MNTPNIDRIRSYVEKLMKDFGIKELSPFEKAIVELIVQEGTAEKQLIIGNTILHVAGRPDNLYHITTEGKIMRLEFPD